MKAKKKIRAWLVAKLGGVMTYELPAVSGKVFQTTMPVEKFIATYDDTYMFAKPEGDAVPKYVRNELIEKIAQDLIECNIIKIRSYEIAPGHVKYVATLYLCRKEE